MKKEIARREFLKLKAYGYSHEERKIILEEHYGISDKLSRAIDRESHSLADTSPISRTSKTRLRIKKNAMKNIRLFFFHFSHHLRAFINSNTFFFMYGYYSCLSQKST
ncbi:MAG: hypothetical protein AABW64_00800 [Nanoarchaeota archaeon]